MTEFNFWMNCPFKKHEKHYKKLHKDLLQNHTYLFIKELEAHNAVY